MNKNPLFLSGYGIITRNTDVAVNVLVAPPVKDAAAISHITFCGCQLTHIDGHHHADVITDHVFQ
jgi:hypothetical protein